jgi:hypothetical protein
MSKVDEYLARLHNWEERKSMLEGSRPTPLGMVAVSGPGEHQVVIGIQSDGSAVVSASHPGFYQCVALTKEEAKGVLAALKELYE